MKQLIEKLIRRRNANFAFDPALNSRLLMDFIFTQAVAVLRGWKLLLKGKSPKFAMLGRGVKFQYNSKISFGKFLKIGERATLSGLSKEGLSIGNNVSIGAFSRVIVSTSLNNLGEEIIIEDNVGLGEFAYLGGAGSLKIGKSCIIGQYFSCHPENHLYSDLNKEIRVQGVSRSGIIIGPDCWIGSKVTILDGVTLGRGCVIAAGAVVNKSFPENSIIGGVPAKLIKTRGIQ